MTIDRRGLILSGLVFLASLQGAAGQGSNDPKAFLARIYGAYVGADSKGYDWRSTRSAGRTFSPDTARLIARDLRESKGEVGRIGADPLIDGQDWEIAAAPGITVEATGPDTARARVALVNLGKAQTIVHDLVRTPAGWRIHDIRWECAKESFRDLLRKPL
ncbi:MAG TPA: hypothetical protein VIL65_14850 [Beijerinckiaceae bacterium]|jgi:hypothetical protein